MQKSDNFLAVYSRRCLLLFYNLGIIFITEQARFDFDLFIYSTNRDEHYVRVCAIKFLCLLDGSNILHKTFMEDIFIKLLDKVSFIFYVNTSTIT